MGETPFSRTIAHPSDASLSRSGSRPGDDGAALIGPVQMTESHHEFAGGCFA
jgi:hypothetical protein